MKKVVALFLLVASLRSVCMEMSECDSDDGSRLNERIQSLAHFQNIMRDVVCRFGNGFRYADPLVVSQVVQGADDDCCSGCGSLCMVGFSEIGKSLAPSPVFKQD